MEINNYFLPEDISINILSRLPTLSVISCSLVRKSWRNLILYNRQLARMYHGSCAYQGRLNFLLFTHSKEEGNLIHYTLDDDDNYEKPEPRLRVLSSNPNPYNNKNYYVVGSCNGLICMAYANAYDIRDFEQPIYICNPITREWLTLPSLTIDECCCSSCSTNNNNKHPRSLSGRYRDVVCGFGYLPSTDEYKVVRITYSSVGRVQVYTLGDGIGWRDKGEITDNYDIDSPCVLANGALHWLDHGSKKLVAFDLADEEFLFIPSPPCFLHCDDYEYPFQIQALGGQFCAFQGNEDLSLGIPILELD